MRLPDARVCAVIGGTLVLGSGLSGCAETAVIASAFEVAQFGTATFTKDTLVSVLPQEYDMVAAAVRAVVEDLQLNVEVDRPQGGFLYLEVTDLTDTSIFLRVQERTPDITAVEIRVGWGGNQPYSTMLMSRIELLLKPTAPTPAEVIEKELDPASLPPPKELHQPPE